MSVEAVEQKELSLQDKMVKGITEAARALNIEVPVEEYAKRVNSLLAELADAQKKSDSKGLTISGQPPEIRQVIKENTVLVAKEMCGQKQFKSGIVLWKDGSFMVSLVSWRDPEGINVGCGSIPINRYDITQVSVRSGEINFGLPKRVKLELIPPEGLEFVRGTVQPEDLTIGLENDKFGFKNMNFRTEGGLIIERRTLDPVYKARDAAISIEADIQPDPKYTPVWHGIFPKREELVVLGLIRFPFPRVTRTLQRCLLSTSTKIEI